jgi:transcriptional regulator with XRE-family HTH domain
VRDPRSDVRAEARRVFGQAISQNWLSTRPDMKIKDIAARSGYSATTVSDVLHGKRFPRKEVAECIVTAWGGNFGEIADLWLRLSESVHNSVPVAPTGVHDDVIAATWYEDNGEFYAAARQSIDTANREIRATYIRQYPPSDVASAEASRYFESMLEWAGRPGPRSLNRIFGVPTGSARIRRRFVDFLAQHLLEIEGRQIKNYQARVFEYTALGDGLNMALFDRDISFVAVSGHGPQNLTGMRVDSEQYTGYLVAYFDQFLSGCEHLAEYLDRMTTKG